MDKNKIKVLIVDDDIVLGTSLKLGLEEMGMTPYYIDSTNTLVEKIKEVQPNILVLDIEIGDDNGLDEMKKLEANGINLPIIIMSSHVEMTNISKALEENACHFMKKPFEIEEMGFYIQRFAKVEEDIHDSILEFGKCQLDCHSRNLNVPGAEAFRLSLKQFQVLSLLAKHFGETVNRQVFKNELWPDGNTSDASLDNYISQLRKLLTPDASICIDTIPKTGFMLRLC